MKRYAIAFFILLISFSAFAAERSFLQKRVAAASVLCTTMRAKGFGNVPPVDSIIELKAMDMVTIMGYANGGFADVANDDCFESIVGYSLSSLSSDSSCSFTWWLQCVNEAMKERNPETTNAYQISHSAKYVASMSPLVLTHWGQGAPYNKLCPTTSDGKPYPTGCVATALAQILYYHKYPSKGVGSHTYSFTPSEGDGRVISADFSSTYYDWNNMIEEYTAGSYNEAQAIAVATLMLQCGVSIDMQYTESGSGAYTYAACNSLRKYFSCNKNIGIHYRDYYSTQQWMDLIYSELNQNRPVLYGGSDTKEGGHCFIIDGYNADGLVHVNWGWNGSNDGYYDVALLNPGSYIFSKAQSLLTGFTDTTVVVPHHSESVSDQAFQAVKFGTNLSVITGTIYNLSDYTFNGRIGIILDGNNQQYELATSNLKSNIATLYSIGSLSSMCSIPSNLPDGSYRVYAAVKDSVDTQWQPVHRADSLVNSVLINKNSASFTISNVNNSVWMSIESAKKTDFSDGKIWVYDLTGRIVYRESSGTFKYDNIPGRGIYIIKNGNTFKKISK